ncbi:MAG: transglycosylase domain-containing protein, partial [Ktedonobacteraceae bacterium]
MGTYDDQQNKHDETQAPHNIGHERAESQSLPDEESAKAQPVQGDEHNETPSLHKDDRHEDEQNAAPSEPGDEHDDLPADDDEQVESLPVSEHTSSLNGGSPSNPGTLSPLPQALAAPLSPVPEEVDPRTQRRRRWLQRMHATRRVTHKRVGRRTKRHRECASRLVMTMAIVFAVLFSIFSGTLGVSYAYYQSQLPQLDGIANHTTFQTTRIYDRNDKLLYEINDPRYGRRTYVNYTDIPKNLIDATVAAEDHTFWTNSGVDFQGIVRAALANYQSHGVVEGASTITQQLIKRQLFLNQPRTVQVKAQEAVLAYGISQQLPKWKIMEMYLNVIFYGELNYGAEAAAQDFFGLQPKCTHTHCTPAVAQLDLAQSSMLAGLPQLPSYYDPVINKQAALDRQKLVLDSMVELHMIKPQQEQQAEQEMAKFDFKPYVDPSMIQAPHFVRYLVDEVLVPMLGAQTLYEGGFNIYTTLDLDLEKKVEAIAYQRLYQDPCAQYLGCAGPLSQSHNVNNAAVVVLDPFNGEILAMDGSVKYDDTNPKVRGQFNSAVDAQRQPGSSIKPVIYATAFEMGWYPAMIIPDHQTVYPTRDASSPSGYYTPQNYDQQFHSSFPMTVRAAIANSFNIPAVDTIEYAGLPNVLNMAGRLGLTTIADQPLSKLGPSLALGSKEVSLLSLTSAYGTFANQGVRVPPASILEITDNQGHPIYTYNGNHPHGVRAVSPEIAFLMSSILSDKGARYHEFGPGNPLELDRPAAAKTGTTNSFVDNWTMGYTPHVAVGVWVGNSDNSPMDNGVIGITGAGPIWHDVMEYVSDHYNYPADDFVKPDDVHQGTVSALTGLLPRRGEPTVSDWFIDGTMPTIMGKYTPPTPTCENKPCHKPGNPNENGNPNGNGNPFGDMFGNWP